MIPHLVPEIEGGTGGYPERDGGAEEEEEEEEEGQGWGDSRRLMQNLHCIANLNLLDFERK